MGVEDERDGEGGATGDSHTHRAGSRQRRSKDGSSSRAGGPKGGRSGPIASTSTTPWSTSSWHREPTFSITGDPSEEITGDPLRDSTTPWLGENRRCSEWEWRSSSLESFSRIESSAAPSAPSPVELAATAVTTFVLSLCRWNL